MKFWVARDIDDMLFIFSKKPRLNKKMGWFLSDSYYSIVDKRFFPEVTFKNSPQEIELKLI